MKYILETDFDKTYEELSRPIFNYGDFIAKKDDRVNPYRKELSRPGIYLYTNDANGHKYVGQAVNLYKRLLEHYQTANREPEEYLEPIDSAINHYKPESFTIEILKFIDNPALLNKWEIDYIDKYNTYNNIEDYNLTPGGNELNYFRQSIFWDEEKQRFDKRSLNKVRTFLQTSTLSFGDIILDLSKLLDDTTKQSDVVISMSPSTTATIRKINNCEGIYKLNYYERAVKGFKAPLNSESHAVGRNQHAEKEFYIFDINETNLVPENAIKGPLPTWREVSRCINDGQEIQDQQIKQVARGLKRDGRPGGNYIYNNYKIKSFVKE